jgi:hypothetical protein
MRGSAHRQLGGLAWVGLGLVAHLDPVPLVLGLPIAVVAAGGRGSPDCDQRPWFRWLAAGGRPRAKTRRSWPRRLLDWVGRQGLALSGLDRLAGREFMCHRGITHWWGLPCYLVGTTAVPPSGPDWLRVALLAWIVVAWAVAVAWASHLVGDFVFGAAHYSPTGELIRPAGIPLTPTGNWFGLAGRAHGLRSFGWTAKLAEFVIMPVAMVVLAAAQMGALGT